MLATTPILGYLACVRAAWVAPVVEPLLTLAAFGVFLFCATAALQGAAPLGDGRRVVAAALAGCAAHLLFTVGHRSRLQHGPSGARSAAPLGVSGVVRVFGRYAILHTPMFLAFGLLPYLSPVPMLDFQLVSLVFAIGGHRVWQRDPPDAPLAAPARARLAELLPIAAVLAFAAVLRLHDLDYNGEFIDESFYAYAREVGNLFYVTSDSRLWPMLSYAVHSQAGTTGVRATTALLGVLTVLCVYGFARTWSAEMDPDRGPGAGERDREQRHRHVALAAAFLAAVASPNLVTSVIGRHDALAFLVYAFALVQIARAARADRPRAMFLGASALLLSFWIRYAVLSYVPLGLMLILYAQVARRDAYLDALLPFALMALIWALFDLDHWRVSWEYARRTPYAGAATVAAESFARVPAVFVSAGLGAAALLRARGSGPRGPALRAAAIAIPALGTVGMVLAHALVARTTLSLERNLTLAVVFGSVLGGWFVVAAARRIPARAVRWAAGGLLAAATTAHAWAIADGEKHAWGDPRPVVAAAGHALERHGLGPETVVWSTDADGGRGNVHALVLGLRGKAIVDNSSPWKPRFWEEARDQAIPLIVGSNRDDPRRPLRPGSMVAGYVVEQRVEVPHGPAAYVYVRRDLWDAARR